MPNDDNSSKSKEKDTGKEKKSKWSFTENLKDIFTGKGIEKQEDGKTQESSEAAPRKTGDKTSVKDKASTYPEKEKTEKKESVSQTKTIPQTKKGDSIPQTKEKDSSQTGKKDTVHEDQEEDPALRIIEDIKSHKIAQWLRTRKEKIIKVVAITISAILILIAIIYSLTPTEQVASNVAFGEGAMFSAFLVLVAVLILAAVYASRLLEGKYLKDIHKDLEIVEGKREKDDHEGKGDQKSSTDPNDERMNKKDK